MKKRNNKKIHLRTIIQLFFFFLVALITINHSLVESGKSIPLLSSASLHAICPFGGVVTLHQFITAGTFVQKLHESSIVLMTIAIFLSVLFGPVICGWVCPLGSVQEWFGKLGKKIFKRKFNNIIPYKYDKYLRFIRYIVLIWVVYVIGTTGKLVFQEFDPYYALFNFWSTEVAASSLVILGIVLSMSLIIERPWCKYACPFGAFMGISNLFRISKIKRNNSTCISCGACDKACPMNINVSESGIIRNHQCISCMKCTSEEVCPINDTVEYTFSSKKIKSNALATSLVIILFGGILISSYINMWQTESTKVPNIIEVGSFKGEYNPEDIKGSYSFGDVSELFSIPLEDLTFAFNIPEDINPSEFKNKDLEKLYLDLEFEIGNGSVKLFVALYKGLPYSLDTDTYLLENAVQILKDKANLTKEQLEFLNNHTVYIEK